MKLEALREEDNSRNRLKFLKTSKKLEDENFFMEDDTKNNEINLSDGEEIEVIENR